MTKVLIAGGGIAGCAAALALHKAGFEPVVCEAYASGGEDAGAFLSVGPNGMLALRQFDADDAVTAAGFPLTTITLTDEDGGTLGSRPLHRPEGDIPGHHHLRRADLYVVLQQLATDRGIRVEHGRRLACAEPAGTGVRAEFTDGTTESADLLIGADGLRSTVRTQIDPDAPPPRYSGQQVFWGHAHTDDPDTTALHMVRGRRANFGYMVSPAGETWWFVRVSGDQLDPARRSATQWRDLLVELFADDHTKAAEIIAATGEDLVADNIYDVPGLRRWHRDGMLVIGDAAHAASPAAGQGASMALEDAVMLAKSLRDLPDAPQAFAAYERLRRNRVERVTTESAALTPKRAPDAAERAQQNQEARARYANQQSAPQWMYDYPLPWEVVITPELAAETEAAQAD